MEEDLHLTPEREIKLRKVVAQRQGDLTIILEDIHDPHNILAILRTCDAVGIMEANIIRSKPVRQRLGKKSSASGKKWVTLKTFSSVAECCNRLKEKGYSIWATHLSSDAKELYDLDLNKPIALAFGNEHDGISEQLLQYADGNFVIPMMGMIPSLNVSVACAVSLYEALRQRKTAGKYDSPSLSEENARELLKNWTDRRTL